MPFDALFNSKLFMRKCFDHSVLNSYFSLKLSTPENMTVLKGILLGGKQLKDNAQVA